MFNIHHIITNNVNNQHQKGDMVEKEWVTVGLQAPATDDRGRESYSTECNQTWYIV